MARLGRCTTALRPRHQLFTSSLDTDRDTDRTCHASSSSDSAEDSPPASLHSELLHPFPKPDNRPTAEAVPTYSPREVAASRPCYRCVAYMHSVGIRRVFWTNENGVWENAKVRDLVDALDSAADCNDSGGPTGNGLFVTKHEVLMLRRLMCDGREGSS